jgi:hypothetical protein
MPTKYELQAELRELNRGFPRVPISKMKYHELEAMIDAIKKTKGDAHQILPTKTPAHGGHYPPRPIPSESVEDEDVVLHVPKKPADRIVKPPPKVKAVKAPVESDEEEPETLKAPKKAEKIVKVTKVAEEPRKSEKKTVHFCNCPDCKHSKH